MSRLPSWGADASGVLRPCTWRSQGLNRSCPVIPAATSPTRPTTRSAARRPDTPRWCSWNLTLPRLRFRKYWKYSSQPHDPTTLNRQGADRGARYRSVILHTTDSQKEQSVDFIKVLDASGTENGPVVTQVVPFEKFYPRGTGTPAVLPEQPRQHVLPSGNQPQGCKGTAEIQLQASLAPVAILLAVAVLSQGERALLSG